VSNPNPFSLPTKEPARTTSLSIRLTTQERQAIDALAEKLAVPPSHMARHFLLQVVAFQQARIQEKSEVK
jgi:predicted transcriptional regulator